MVLPRWIVWRRAFCLLVIGVGVSSRAQTSWINPGNGFWRENANWSAGVPSFSISLTQITNANTKTVTVDAATSTVNLEVDRLTISAPSGQTNLLLLDNLSAVGDFKVVGLAAVNRGGAIRIRNSTLFVDGFNGGAMDVNAGELTLESGGITLGEFGRFRLGIGGPGTVDILNGAFSAGADFIIGGGLSGGQGTVNVLGGELNIATDLVIADEPGSIGNVLVNGGKLVATNDVAIARIGDDGTGTLTLQTGSIEFWDVSVGRSAGASGTWTISGGTAQTKDVSVGRFEGATGILNVTSGSLLLPDDSLLIGREGSGQVNISGGLVVASDVTISTNATSSGTLTISGGTLETEEFVVGATSGAAGTVTVNGGEIQVNNDTNTANFVVVKGTVTMNAGTVETDSLLITNGTGSLKFNGGSIVSSGTRIANGQPFVIGDGTHPAVFRMDGGTHTFQNGLVISANASVIGCGQIIGAIQNNGTLSTNCNTTAPMLISSQRSGNQFSFQIQSEAGVTYTVEYKETLNDPAWTKLGTYAGTGSAVTVTDTIASATRFYRVVIY
jgi:T5SS/PEP-CTERM-associated repeat protein